VSVLMVGRAMGEGAGADRGGGGDVEGGAIGVSADGVGKRVALTRVVFLEQWGV